MKFSNAQVILFVEDCERAAAFYATFGFVETFRAPQEAPIKIEMSLDGFELGFALPGPAAESHHITVLKNGYGFHHHGVTSTDVFADAAAHEARGYREVFRATRHGRTRSATILMCVAD